MTDWLYPTAFSSWRPGDGGDEDLAIQRVLRSGCLTMGPEVEALEAELAAYHGCRHAIAVNSGSSANLVAVQAIVHKLRYENLAELTPYAFVPAVAWATTYAPLAQQGCYFILHDVDDTWNALPKELSGHPRRPLPFIRVLCSILGNPAYGKEWEEPTADNEGSYLIEDNCESIGARTKEGRLCGTFGHLSTLSFFWSHQLSAIEGGAILTDDDELARLCRLLMNHGNQGWASCEVEKKYNFTVHGYNLRMTELHAAVAREQLRRLDNLVIERQANWNQFADLTSKLPIKLQRVTGYPSPFGMAFTVEDAATRSRLVGALRDRGIDSRLPTGGSFTRHPYGAAWRDQPTPNADKIHDTGLFLGCAPYPIPRLVDHAVKVMKETL